MLKLHRKKTIIVCISLLAMTLAITAFAETMGQKIMRLKREKEQGTTTTTYTRAKPADTTKKTTRTKPNTAPKISTSVTIEAEKPVQPETQKTVVTALETKKAVLDASDPMNLVPADALVCLRINDFGGSVSKLDQYISGTVPMPPMSMMVNGMVANIIGNPMVSGINFSGNVIAYINNDMKALAPPIVILVPVTNYEEFTSGNPHCSKPDADGISTIAPPKAMLGKLVTAKAPGGKYAYVTLEPLKAYLTKTPGSEISNSLAAKLSANEQKLATTAPLWVYGNVEQAVAAFKPMLGMALQSIPKQGDVDLSAMTLDALNQLKSLSITLTPTEQKLALGLSVSAKPGSEIAKALMADPAAKPGFKLAGYLNDKAAMNIALKVNKNLFKIINDFSIFMMESNPAMAVAMPGDMKSIMTKSLDSLGSEAVYSISTGSGSIPFSFKMISDIIDAEKINEMYDQQIKMISSQPKALGMSMSQSETYSNCKIYTMKMAPPQIAPGAPSIAVNMNMAVSDDKMLTCMGDIDDLKTLIQTTKTRAPRPSGDMAKALRLVDNSADMDFVASLNLLRMISMGGKVMNSAPIPGAKMIGGMLSGLNANSKSCMALAGKVDGGRVDASVVLPKEHLVEVFGAVMQMQMQMQQQMQKQMMQQMQQGPNGGSGSFKMKTVK